MANWIEHKSKLIFLKFFRYLTACGVVRDFIARQSALFTYMLDRNKIRIMRNELRRLMGDRISEKQAGSIIIDGICDVRRDLFETWTFPSLTEEKIRDLSYFSGKKNLEEASAKKKGVIIILTHFGFRKLILPALAYEGYRINQIAAKPTSWKLDGKDYAAHNKIMDIELECEKALKTNFIYLEDSLRPVFRALSNNEIVAIAIDGPIGNKRIGVKFFDGTAFFSPTAISLSLKTGAPMIPAFVIREGNNRHKIVLEKPLSLDTSVTDTESISKKAMAEFVSILEKYVSAYPSHYVDWFYRARIWPIEQNFFVFQ